VNGDNIYLTDNRNASMIRALLLSAIRSFILWQQSGGNKFRIFLFKKKMAEIALKV
jgi:high frequency lysogenization protein